MGGKRHLLVTYWRLFFLSLCFVSLMLLPQNPVFAQEDDSDDSEEFLLEDVIVTAQKREAELQSVPMAIDVVRQDDMLRLGVFDTQDLDKILPDLSIEVNAGNFMQINIREVQNLIWNPEYETTVALHLDGANMTRSQGFNGYFYDIERVEVLNGPSGTLYGRGSTAGAMNIITRKAILG